MSLELIVPYQPSLLALAALILCILIQSLLTAPLAFIRNEQSPGMPLRGDHTQLSFRALRTYQNSVENLPAFGLALALAILLGVKPALVNWAACLYVGFRMLFWALYYSGAGRHAGGPRSMSYVGGLICNGVLVVAGLFTLWA